MDILLRNNDKKRYLILALLTILFILTHIIYLESDLPFVGITLYYQVDEMYYNNGAFNTYHYGNPVQQLVSFLPPDDVPTRIVPELFTLLGLLLFGNNYYGLRMPSLFAAVLVFALLSSIIVNAFRQKNQSLMAMEAHTSGNLFANGTFRMQLMVFFTLLMYMLTDFAFLNASRISEPTIIRMLVMTIFIYACSQMKPASFRSVKAIFILGFLASCAVLFVYIYNLFIYAALALLVFFYNYIEDRRIPIKVIFLFILGTLAGIGLFSAVSSLLFEQSIIDYFAVMAPFSSRLASGVSDTSFIHNLIRNFAGIFITNFFRYNPAILFIFLIALPPFLYKAYSEKQVLDVFASLLLGFLFFQTLVINDYMFRKLIILMPLVIIVIFEAFIIRKEFAAQLTKSKMKYRAFRYYWLIFTSFAVMFSFALSIWPAALQTMVVLPEDVSIINIAVFIIVFMLITGYFWNRLDRSLLIMSLILLLIPNIYMDYKYVYSRPTFHFKEIMVDMGQYTNDNITAGGFSYAFRLYNTSIPVLDSYSYYYPKDEESKYQHEDYARLFDEGIARYSIAMELPDCLKKELGIADETVKDGVVSSYDRYDITTTEYMEMMGMELVKEYDSPEYYRVYLYKHPDNK